MPKDTKKDVTNADVPVKLKIVDGEMTGRGDEETRRPIAEQNLDSNSQTLVRTEPGAAVKADGRYRKEYMIQVRGKVDWDDPVHTDMHEANKLNILDAALHAGLHPKSGAIFDGEDVERSQSGSALLVYSVEVVPAGLDEDAAGTVVPRGLLLDMPGASTIVGDDGVNHR
jgi:hypothetical protein